MPDGGALRERIAGGDLDLGALAAFLDGLGQDERVHEVRSLPKPEQARLYDAAAGFRTIGLEDLVDPGRPPLREVVHAGRNSLAAFRVFEKRFCRPPDADAGVLWGYNEHAARWMTGPGYFVARAEGAGPGEVTVDYREVPPGKPESWPAIRPNSALRGRFVYGGMVDVLRGVSRHVCVGRATRRGKPMDSWFVLCRLDPAPA
jgi:hypothetical protein